MACELLDIEPAEAVFLDDLGVNLKPARAMGMRTIKVVDPAGPSPSSRRSSAFALAVDEQQQTLPAGHR